MRSTTRRPAWIVLAVSLYLALPPNPANPAGAPYPSALEPFFQALAKLESGQRRRPVTIIQLGDSHTANGSFSNHLRNLFQHRFGAAGRGMLPPGDPYDYYRPGLVAVSQGPGWQVYNSYTAADGIYGLSGFRLRSDGEARMAIESTEKAGFDHAELGVLTQPGGGSLTVVIDGRESKPLSTAGADKQLTHLIVPAPAGSRRLELHTRGDGVVELLSWTVQRQHPGIVYDNHGIVGATVNVIGRWNRDALARELAGREPALLLLAFGTNEGFESDTTRDAYRRDFAERLALLAALAPAAAIVVIGPPDGNRLPRACRKQRPDGRFGCAPLSAEEQADYTRLFGAEARGRACRWHPPPNLAIVRAVQREVAAARGYYFWDWSRLMNGDCGIHDWAETEPSLAYPDHVHLRDRGYGISATALFQELMGYYVAYQTARQAR